MSMSAVVQLPAYMTVDEFLAWHPEDGRAWQLIDGEPQAMAPASEPHALIQAEAAALLRNHLVAIGSPCAVAVAAGVRPRVRASTNIRIPDLAVRCGLPAADAKLTDAPILAIEILAPSNERETWESVWSYATVPSLQEVLVIRQATIRVDVLRRRPDGSWPDDLERIEQGPLHLASIDFTCDVAAFYRTTHLARRAE
jgi:Uma2 family endonuclease